MRGAKIHFLSIEPDPARIFMIDAEQTFHQSGFSGAVFPHQSVDRAGTHAEINALQRLHAGELFDDALHSKQVFRFFLLCSLCIWFLIHCSPRPCGLSGLIL